MLMTHGLPPLRWEGTLRQHGLLVFRCSFLLYCRRANVICIKLLFTYLLSEFVAVKRGVNGLWNCNKEEAKLSPTDHAALCHRLTVDQNQIRKSYCKFLNFCHNRSILRTFSYIALSEFPLPVLHIKFSSFSSYVFF